MVNRHLFKNAIAANVYIPGLFAFVAAAVGIDVTSAVEEQHNGILLRIRVTTGSDAARFPAGYDQWRKCVEATVTAAPERGKANRELLELMATFFDLAADEIALAYGHTSREKGVLIRRPNGFVIQRLNYGL